MLSLAAEQEAVPADADAVLNETIANATNATINASVPETVADIPDADDPEEPAAQEMNYASNVAGAVILATSVGAENYASLLADSRDQYGIAPCAGEKKWVVIGLSEDIRVKSIVLSNYEKYSSAVKDFQVLGSQQYPAREWVDLGTFRALHQSTGGEQRFSVATPSWARYLKMKFLTHYGEEFYCTLTQLKVHVSAAMESFQEDLDAHTDEMEDVKSALGEVDVDEDVLMAADPVPAADTVAEHHVDPQIGVDPSPEAVDPAEDASPVEADDSAAPPV